MRAPRSRALRARVRVRVRERARRAWVGGAFGALGVIAIACNAVLGIEEGSPKQAADGGPMPDAPSKEASVAPTRCTIDGDCVPPSGCYTGRCDTVLGACNYALCETRGKACSVGTCDTATSTCGNARDYGMRATAYGVNAALGCKSSAQACVAAAYPFLFIGTKDDTIALLVDDLAGAAAKSVPIAALGFRPAALVASGRRVWILADVQGTAGPAPYLLQVAWIDVPSDPTVSELAATTARLVYPFQTYAAFPAPDGALYLADNDPALGFPVARLAPPLPSQPTLAVVNAPDGGAPAPPASVPMYRLPAAPPASALVASSGARLVVYRLGAQVVNLVKEPASPKVALGGDLAITPPLPALAYPRWGQGPDGTVFLAGPIVADPPPPSVDCSCYTHSRLQWILPNAAATASDASQLIDVEGYASPLVAGQPCHTCNPSYVTLPSVGAWIDAKTVIVAAPASDPDRALTATRIVTRDPPAYGPKRRLETATTQVPSGNLAVDRLALAASAGFAYELLANSEGNQMTLSIFDPRCEAP